MEGGGDSGKDDTSEKDMEEEDEEEEECKICLYKKNNAIIFPFSVNTKITDAIGKLSSNSSSPKWKRSSEDEVNLDLLQSLTNFQDLSCNTY